MLLRHSVAYLFARGVPGIINFASLAIVTRIVDPGEYGTYALIFSAVTVLNAVLFEWLRLGMLRFLPKNTIQRDLLLSTVLLWYLCITALVAIIVVGLIATGGYGKHSIAITLLGGLLLVSYAWHEINLELARSELAPWRYGLLSLGRQCLFLIVGGSLAYLGLGGEGLVAGLIAGCVLPSLVSTTRHWRECSLRGASASIGWRLVKYGLPLTASVALTYVLSMSDRILIGWMIGTEAAGMYAVGYDLPRQTTGMLMMVVTLAAYPITVRALEQSGEAAARAQLRKNIVLLMMIGMPATAGMAILSDEIASLVIGEEFRETAATIMPWIAVGALLQGTKVYYLDHSFQLAGKTVPQMWVALVAASISIIGNIILLPQYGVIAAAYTTVVAYLFAVILSYVLGRRVFPVPIPARELMLISVATVGMIMFLVGLKAYQGAYPLVLKIVGGGAVYGGTIVVLNLNNIRTRLLSRLVAVQAYERGEKAGSGELRHGTDEGQRSNP